MLTASPTHASKVLFDSSEVYTTLNCFQINDYLHNSCFNFAEKWLKSKILEAACFYKY